MSDTLNKILATATQLFFKYGIRSVSMDDLARELGVSKKTLYQYVDNKADLVQKAIEVHFNLEEKTMRQIAATHENAIDEMLAIANQIIQMLGDMNPTIAFDLKKYYRSSWEWVENHRKQVLYKTIVNNITNGVAQGLYRQNLKPELIALFYIAKSESIVALEHNYKPVEAFIEFFKYHIYGIASEQGGAYLKNNLQKVKNSNYAN